MCDPAGLVLIVDSNNILPPGELVARGSLLVAPGVPLLHEPDAVLVASVYDDYRREHRGEAALAFLLRHGDAFPRADVLGRRASTGAAVEIYLKQLDLGAGLRVFVYHTMGDPALDRLEAVVWARAGARGWARAPADAGHIPVWLRESVPCWDAEVGALAAPPADLFADSSA